MLIPSLKKLARYSIKLQIFIWFVFCSLEGFDNNGALVGPRSTRHSNPEEHATYYFNTFSKEMLVQVAIQWFIGAYMFINRSWSQLLYLYLFDLPMQCDHVILSFCATVSYSSKTFSVEKWRHGIMCFFRITEQTEQTLDFSLSFSTMNEAFIDVIWEWTQHTGTCSFMKLNWRILCCRYGNSSVSRESEKIYQVAVKVCVKGSFSPLGKESIFFFLLAARNSWENWQLN